VNRSPAFQLYPDKALAGTIHLSPEAFTAYWRLIFWMWLHSPDHCSISNEKSAICAASQLNLRSYERIWVREIMAEWHPMFRIEGNLIVCNGLRKEVEKQKRFQERASKGGQAKAKHNLSTQQAVLDGCTPSPSPSLSLSTLNPPTPLVASTQDLERIEKAAVGVFGSMPVANVSEWLKHHKPHYILEAIRVTESAGKRNAAYCNAILQRWKREGYPPEAQSKADQEADAREIRRMLGTENTV